MTKKIDHIHKYQRTTIGMKKYLIYRCMIPGCHHYIEAKLILNRISECWRCGNPFVIEKYASSLAKPHCANCIKSPKQDIVNKLAEIFE